FAESAQLAAESVHKSGLVRPQLISATIINAGEDEPDGGEQTGIGFADGPPVVSSAACRLDHHGGMGPCSFSMRNALAAAPNRRHISVQAVHPGRPMFSGRGESPHRR